VLSLRRHCPGIPVLVSCPGAPARLRDWCRDQGATVHDAPGGARRGWDVKADLLLDLLGRGHPRVLWVDSDVLLAGPLPRALHDSPDDALVVTEEPYWDTRRDLDRTRAWGLPPGRRLPRTLNTGLLRVTPRHVALLEAWRELLGSPDYRQAQAQPWHQRPAHLVGAQGVLEALLGSQRFAAVPVVALRRGLDIAQCHGPSGYTAWERLRTVAQGRAVPPLLHALGGRPWDEAPVGPAPGSAARALGYVNRLHHELSPYTAAARAYATELPEVQEWCVPRSRTARVLAAAAAGHAGLQELPLAVLDASARRTRELLRPAGAR
jgi:hypothetical protein